MLTPIPTYVRNTTKRESLKLARKNSLFISYLFRKRGGKSRHTFRGPGRQSRHHYLMKTPIGYSHLLCADSEPLRTLGSSAHGYYLTHNSYVRDCILRVGSSDVLSVQRQQRRSGAAGSMRCGSGDGLSEKFTASGGACFQQFIGLMHP